MTAVTKIKIIDEDAQNEKPDANKKVQKTAKKKTVKKVGEKGAVKTKKRKNVKTVKKDSVSIRKKTENKKVDVLKLKKEETSAKEEVKKDIFANIDNVKKIIEEDSDQNKEKRETAVKNIKENIENKNYILGDKIAGESEDYKDDVYAEKNNKSLNIYKKIAYFFIFLVFVLVLFVLYLSFVRVKIILIPNQEKISNNMIFDIHDKDMGEAEKGVLSGVIKKEAIESLDTFEAEGTEVIGKEAVGEIIIINSYSQNQPLVASTRMIPVNNPDKLFRLKETVNVPSRGELKAEIYADEPSPEMAIKPTRFTIPGLWAGLQDKIYAESKNDIVYRQKVKKYIIESDFDNAKKDLRQKLLSEAKAEINDNYKEYGEIIYKIDENSIVSNFNDEIGDELEEFEASIKADVVIVAFDEEKAALMAQQKFISSLSSNKELISFDEDNIIYALNNYDTDKGEATVNASFEGRVSIKEGSNIIEVDKILGLKKDQLDVYLASKSDLAGFEMKFYPSFLPKFLKKVPRLPGKVEIEIKK